jgi:protein-tyrosine phosphatase
VPVTEDLAEQAASGETPMLDTASRRYLLLEPPWAGRNPDPLCETIFQLGLRGMVPVIAHPELCEMFGADPDLASRVTRQGALLQVTAASVLSVLRTGSPSLLADMLAAGQVHVIASDTHGARYRPPTMSEARAACVEAFGEAYADVVLRKNPARILSGRDVLAPKPETAQDTRPAGSRFGRAVNALVGRPAIRPGRGRKRDG